MLMMLTPEFGGAVSKRGAPRGGARTGEGGGARWRLARSEPEWDVLEVFGLQAVMEGKVNVYN